MVRPKKVTVSVQRLSGPQVQQAEREELGRIAAWFGFDSTRGLPISPLVGLIPTLFYSVLFLLLVCMNLCKMVVDLSTKMQLMEKTLAFWKRMAQVERGFVTQLQKTLVLLRRQKKLKPWKRLSVSGRSRRRKRAQDQVENARAHVGHSIEETAKVFHKQDLVALVEAVCKDKIGNKLKALICTEIQDSISVDTVVRLKDQGNISDSTYATLVKLSPDLQKILPKPYHTLLRRRKLDEDLKLFDPQETPDGVDLNPELLFVCLVKKFNLHASGTIECCISLDARPVRRRGKFEPQTVVGFKLCSQSPTDCFKQGT